MSVPYVKIVEQPAERSFRFRYESEGRLSGSILGVQSTVEKPSYPKIEIGNFVGTAHIIVTCVSDKQPHQQHPHKISSKSAVRPDGSYQLAVNVNQMTVVEFKDIGIVFVKKQNIETSLTKRKEKNFDPTRSGWEHMGRPQLIDLHCVRLCFQVVCSKNMRQQWKVVYAISNPIIDKKSNGLLKIVDINPCISSAHGGDKILLFCDKVKREDIEIRLFEEDANKKVVWRGEINCNNSKMKVHHQYGISFETPPYKDFDIIEPRKLFLQLFRPSDHETSEPLPFEYIPNQQSVQLRRKRHKKISERIKIPLNAISKPKKKDDPKVNNTKSDQNTPLGNISNHNHAVVDVNPYPLIDLSEVEKENQLVPTPVESYVTANDYQTPITPLPQQRPLEMPYPNYAANDFQSYYYLPHYTQQNNNYQCVDQTHNYNAQMMHNYYPQAQPQLQEQVPIQPQLQEHQPHHTHQTQPMPQQSHHLQQLQPMNVYRNGCNVNGYQVNQENLMPVNYQNENIRPQKHLTMTMGNARLPSDSDDKLSDLVGNNTNDFLNEKIPELNDYAISDIANMDGLTSSMELVSLDNQNQL